MKNEKRKMKNYKILVSLPIICLALSCNSGAPQKTATSDKAPNDSGRRTSVDSTLKAKDSVLSGTYSIEKIKKLLSHFPDNNNYPVTIDSAYMANVAKGHDSLGTNEVKMLVRRWHDDDLLTSDSSQVCDFYKIDSLKAHHKFTGQYKEGMPTYANVYALKKIGMKEQTLLVWALVTIQEDADPVYTLTTVYYTILNNNTILETGIMGSLMTGADPPGEYQTILSSRLSEDGKLRMEQAEFSGDMDSMKAEIKHTHYEYLIHQGYTKLMSKKQDTPVDLKMKN
jgi:hypothetical protein